MSFSIVAFFVGLLILASGGAIVIFYQPIANNLAHGVSDYNKVRIAGLIVAAIGFIVMANLHTTILSGIVNLIFP